jgi:uncharacterized lipoprotein YddW (UPF0748 family)
MKKIRGIWITNVNSDILQAEDDINKYVKRLAQTGFNVVFPVVWWGGYTLFQSKEMMKRFPEQHQKDLFLRRQFKQKQSTDKKFENCLIHPDYAGTDPLQVIVDAAHRHYMKVIPWFEFGFGSSNSDSYEYGENDYVLSQYPSFAAKRAEDKAQNLYKPEAQQFRWMNAFNPEVQEFVEALILEICQKYAIDGIQGDERLPAFPAEGATQFKSSHSQQIDDEFIQAVTTGWEKLWEELSPSPLKEKLYGPIPKPRQIPDDIANLAKRIVDQNQGITDKERNNVLSGKDEVDRALIYLWTAFRARKLSKFLQGVSQKVKTLGKEKQGKLLVSMAPECYPDGFTENLQDYETWLPVVDLIHPQLYRFNNWVKKGEYVKAYIKAFDDQKFDLYGKAKEKISVGINVRKDDGSILSPDDLKQMIDHNRRHGIRGEVLFYLFKGFFGVDGNNLEAELPYFLRADTYRNNSLDDEGPDAAKIQYLLKNVKKDGNQNSYYNGEVNGIFDKNTENAVIAFQEASGLKADGIVDPRTIHALGFGSNPEDALLAFGQFLPWE